jgi:hypothetical protein
MNNKQIKQERERERERERDRERVKNTLEKENCNLL